VRAAAEAPAYITVEPSSAAAELHETAMTNAPTPPRRAPAAVVPVEQPVYRPAPPAAPNPTAPEDALKDSGLVLVETRSDAKVELPSPEPEVVPAKRERKPAPATLDEPLVQVETQK